MERGLRRRDFLRISGLGAAASFSGCQAIGSSEQTETEPVEGTVLSLDGEPIEGATVEAVVGGGEVLSEDTTDGNGEFGVETGAGAVWLRAEASGFLTRTVAAAPESSSRIRLTPKGGTVSLSFGGDVMFGRRFYDDSESSGYPWFRIHESGRQEDHEEILSHIQPLLSTADITSVNLETTLTTTEWRHTSKRFVYSSHPVAATALRDAGVDYAALGNNHVFDTLKPGLDDTFAALGSAEISYSGAGDSSETAWEPAYFEENGLVVGMVSCTTIAGAGYQVNWSADREDGEYSFVQEIDGEEQSLSFSGSVGVAEATEERIADRVREANETADVTVVQIHGGEEYQRTPTSDIERLTEAACEAGADLVVNHHPHVTGGLEFRDGALVAWTLGNLVFDQVLWETFPSYLLTVHVTDDGVKRAYVDPLLLDGYVPKGVVGEPREEQLRRTAGLSSDEFSMRQKSVEYVDGGQTRRYTEGQSFEGEDDIFERETGWVSDILEGEEAVETGRDLLPTGEFERHTVDEDSHEGTLWRFDRKRAETGPGVGVDGTGGISISRHQSNSSRVILSQCARNRFSGSLTLTGLYRYDAEEGLELLVKWHESSGDTDAVEETTYTIDGTGGDWMRLRKDLQPPEDASYVDLYFRVYPPSPRFPVDIQTERIATFDELRLIDWGEEAENENGERVRVGKEYDHLRVDGSATVEVTAEDEREVEWKAL